MIKSPLFILAAMVLAGSIAKADTQITVRTNQIAMDNAVSRIAAVTSDFRFYAIVCKMGYAGFTSSKADLLAPNSKGDLTTENYDKDQISLSAYSTPKSDSWPLTEAAISQVCNHPNGEYTLNMKSADGKTVVDFIGGHSVVAETPKASRGF